jgi:hypothetical protein
MMTYLFDGRKATPLYQLRDEAWASLSGGERVDTDMVRKFYKRVGLIYRCVHVRAGSLMKVPWHIHRGDRLLWEYGHGSAPPPLELAWLKPLPELLRMSEAALCLNSQAYWFIEKNRVRVTQLKWLAPISMTPVWDTRFGLTHFDRSTERGTTALSPEEVVYIWVRDPMHETQPDPAPAMAALDSAGVLFNTAEFISSYFQRGAVKVTILGVKGAPPPDERKRLRDWWQRVAAGVKNAFAAEVVAADAITPVVIGEGLSDLSNTELTEEARNDIATAMGVPHSVLFSSAANYATAVQDEQNFYNLTIIPDCKLIADQVNEQLLNAYGLHLEWHPDEMDVFQTDEMERAQAVKLYVDAGMKLSLAAQILGVDLPDDMAYTDLDTNPPPGPAQAEPRYQVLDASPVGAGARPAQLPAPAGTESERQSESRRFRAWAKKRIGKTTFDPAAFESDLLSAWERAQILADLEDGIADDAPFCDGTAYP